MFLVFAVNFLSAIWMCARICARESSPLWRMWVGFLTIPLTVVVARHSPTAALMVLHLPALSTPLVEKYLKWREHRLIVEHLRELVENMILTMRGGKSFRSSLHDSVAELQDGPLARVLRSWAHSMPLHQKAPSQPVWWSNVAAELLAIDQQSHQALNRLRNWRSRLKFEADFRRRVGQVVTQVRLQVFVISGIYLALLGFTLARGSWSGDSTLIGLSMALFATGLLIILRLGRRIKWTF